MNKENFNWKSFKRSIVVKSDIEDCYSLIATPERITKWFIGEAIYTSKDGNVRDENDFAQAGDSYYWKWFHKDFEVEGKILEANDKDFFKFTFGDAGIVSITLKKINDRILLELYQETYPDKPYDKFAHINCYACWSFFLANLKSVIENGIDLRETELSFDELVNR